MGAWKISGEWKRGVKNIPGPNLSVNLQQEGRTCKLRTADQVRAGYLVSDPLFPFFWPNFFLDCATPTSSCPGWKYLLFVSLLPPIGFCVQCQPHWVTSYLSWLWVNTWTTFIYWHTHILEISPRRSSPVLWQDLEFEQGRIQNFLQDKICTGDP